MSSCPQELGFKPCGRRSVLFRGFIARGRMFQEKLVRGQGSVCLSIVAQAGEEPVFMQRDCRNPRDVISICHAGIKSAEMRRDPSPRGNVINPSSIIDPQTS